MAAKYIFGSQKISGTIKTLSQSTRSITSGLLSDPDRIENIIGLVRTAAPLTSEKTVAKINTYLPPFELVSTLLSMYAFLNKTQNYSPIKSLNANTPLEKVSALISNGNLPIGKIIAQPIIANNMDKIISSLAKGFIGNNNANINDLISSMLVQNSNTKSNSGSSGDLSSLMETFMPLISNMMSDNSSNSDHEHQENTQHQENMVHQENNEELSDNIEENQNIDLNEREIIDNTKAEEHNSIHQPKSTPIRIRQRRKNSNYNKRMI